MPPYRWGSPAVQALESVRELSWGADDPTPIIMAYHPVARMNPYQSLLYSSSWDDGVAAIPLQRLDDLGSVEAAGAAVGVPVVLHLHWTSEITRGAASVDEAMAKAAAFDSALSDFQSAGGRIVWTVHNVLPHDCPFPEVEARLRQGLADRADLIHVMARSTMDLVLPYYSLDEEKVVFIPHPSYLGAYAGWMSKRQARYELEIGFNELVWGFIGQVRPNKGLDLLADALDEIALRRPDGAFRLLLAGQHPDGMPSDTLRRLRQHPWVSAWPTRIDHNDMQTFVRATDVILLPYEQSLNSGMAHLAASMGRPIIAPLVGGMTELLDELPGLGYLPNDVNSLADAMLSAPSLVNEATEEAALASSRNRDPSLISRQFITAVRSTTV